MMAGPYGEENEPEDVHNNCLSAQAYETPMPRGFTGGGTMRAVVQRRLDGHSTNGIGMEGANFHDPSLPKESEEDPTMGYGYYGENDRL